MADYTDDFDAIAKHMTSQVEKNKAKMSCDAYRLYKRVGPERYKSELFDAIRDQYYAGKHVGIGNIRKGLSSERKGAVQEEYDRLQHNFVYPMLYRFIKNYMEPLEFLQIVLEDKEKAKVDDLPKDQPAVLDLVSDEDNDDDNDDEDDDDDDDEDNDDDDDEDKDDMDNIDEMDDYFVAADDEPIEYYDDFPKRRRYVIDSAEEPEVKKLPNKKHKSQ